MLTPGSRWTALLGLAWTLARTDFKTRYHGSFGGYLWALAKPVSMFVVLLAVFSFVFGMDPDYRLNLIIGLFLWDFFAESTRSGLGSLHAKAFLVTRAQLPRWVVVVTSSSNAVATLVLFAVVICLWGAAFERPLGFGELTLFALYLLLFLVVVIGFSLAASVLFLRYRDLNQVWDLALQAGFFVAPVVYPLEIIPERFHLYLYAWPPTPVIQFTRSLLVEGVVPSGRAHLLLVASAALALATGALVYRRLAPRVVEEL